MTVASTDLAAARTDKVRAWDLPTRSFHWLLVALIIDAYLTRTFSHDPTLYWHRMNGYAILILVLFRVLWGFVGSSTSRFASFFPLPGPTLRYAFGFLRGRAPHYLGHNPLGSIIIYLMLLAVLAQAIAGLFTSDDTLAQGPLVDHVSDHVVARASFYHSKGFWIIVALAAIHITANLFYQFVKKDRLITSMVTGRKDAQDYCDHDEAVLAPPLRAAICLLVAVVIVVGGVYAAGGSILQ